MIEILVSKDCDVSADVIYEMLADFGSIGWMKGVAESTVDGEGVGMVRNIFTGPDNPPVREKLVERDDLARRIGYTIPEGNPLPVDEYSATVTVSEMGDGSRIDWAGTMVAKGTDEATAKATVEGMYGVLIDWLVEGAKA
ncbi:MAG: hypothetical protein ACI8W3_002613 [Myxococcota bacterium]